MRRPTLSLADILLLPAETTPEAPAVATGDGTRMSFAEMADRVGRLASALAAQGVGHGDRVAMLALDGPGYLETLLASLRLGATYVPLNYKLAPGEVETLLRRAQAKVLFCDGTHVEMTGDLKAAVDELNLVVSYDASGGDRAYDELLADGSGDPPQVDVDDADIVGLAFTSGTTGLPKGVLQSQAMLKAMMYARQVQYDLQPGDFRYGASPMFHIAGQVFCFGHLMRGIPSLILPRFDTDSVLRWMQSGELTGCFLVPTMIGMLLNHPQAAASDYANLRVIIYGSAPMSPSLLRRAIDRFGCSFINAFGAGTEAGLQTLLSAADHEAALDGREHLLGSIGRPATGVRLRIVDEAGRDVAVGEVGEIITRSDTVMSGYLDMPDQTARAFRDGWFWGGDLARRDEEGYLYLAGRSKDMIIRGGENIYPSEIESVIAEYPGIREVSVIGVPDELWGETVAAVVTTLNDEPFDAEDLRSHCRQHLAGFKVPVEIRHIEAMPYNPSGKILKRELRRRWSELAAASPA